MLVDDGAARVFVLLLRFEASCRWAFPPAGGYSSGVSIGVCSFHRKPGVCSAAPLGTLVGCSYRFTGNTVCVRANMVPRRTHQFTETRPLYPKLIDPGRSRTPTNELNSPETRCVCSSSALEPPFAVRTISVSPLWRRITEFTVVATGSHWIPEHTTGSRSGASTADGAIGVSLGSGGTIEQRIAVIGRLNRLPADLWRRTPCRSPETRCVPVTGRYRPVSVVEAVVDRSRTILGPRRFHRKSGVCATVTVCEVPLH